MVKQKLLVVKVRDKVPGLVLTWFCYGSVRKAKASDILQLAPLTRCSGPVCAVLCALDFSGEEGAAELCSHRVLLQRARGAAIALLLQSACSAAICTSPTAAFTLQSPSVPGELLLSAEQGERCFEGSTVSW